MTYYWLHIPTGARGVVELAACPFLSLEAQLLLINRWNASAPGVWQYWMRA